MTVVYPMEVFSNDDGDNQKLRFSHMRLKGRVSGMSLQFLCSRNRWLLCLLLGSLVVVVSMIQAPSSRACDTSWDRAFHLQPDGLKVLGSEDEGDFTLPSSVTELVPKALLGTSYLENDFINDAGVVPTYWNCSRVPADCVSQRTWGPCYVSCDIRWTEEVERFKGGRETSLFHTPEECCHRHDMSLAGYCRPGFLILGAGKCGTSSLYHYLTDHPRVLPAKEKQIHYFKYHTKRSMKWYLSHFPTAKSFLASGALMTGEASPGYLPYPDVASLVAERMPGTRLIVLGRDPIDRMYSSYTYSYVYPTIKALRKGRVSGVPIDLSDAQYQQKYLFSFEDMIQAELIVLKECLSPNGTAVVQAQEYYGNKLQWQSVFSRRKEQGLPPLADLDSFCYGKRVNKTVLRMQWAELNYQYPEKVILDENTHLLQSHLGRSIYALALEWWYGHFDAADIFFMCTEEMKDLSGISMEPLRKWLGLPKFNFSETLSRGAFNVGGHRGYDSEVKWDVINNGRINPNSLSLSKGQEIPLSAELRAELQEFLMPFNERLFKLTGRRCKW